MMSAAISSVVDFPKQALQPELDYSAWATRLFSYYLVN